MSKLRTMHPILVALLAAALGETPARPAAAQAVRGEHVTAELVSGLRAIAPGERWTVALRLVPDEHWHTYWRNPGDAGSPPAVDWSLPPGFRAGPLLFPPPRRIAVPPLAAYGYDGEALFLTEMTAPADLAPGGTATLRGHASWVVCREDCVAGEADLSLRLPVTARGETGHWASPLGAVLARVPRPITGWRIGARETPDGYLLRLDPPPARRRPLEGVLFFAESSAVIEHAADQPLALDGDAYTLTLIRSPYATGAATHLAGVLVSSSGWDSAGAVGAVTIDAPVAGGAAAAGISLGLALILALLGGVLLNLMPCVFPVMSLKVLEFASLAADRRGRAWRHGIASGAGVVATFWALGGTLLVLRRAGTALGWGFQLQSPAFVAGMALLMFVLGLVLVGAVEIGVPAIRLSATPRARPALLASFGTGVLATVLATPCTAPFMGVALGFGLTLPATSALLVFTALGLGMAAPYALLAASPALLRHLPRPGAWMETFKQAMAFPLFGTAAWLAWVLTRQTGPDGVLRLLAGFTLAAAAAWLVGRWGGVAARPRPRAVARGLATVLALGALAVAVPSGPSPEAPRSEAAAADGWEPWSPERVAELRQEGRPILVDFTAAWCLTCKVNERVALGARVVRERLRALGVAALRADWTRRDPAIAAALATFGRNAVPLTVVYPRDPRRPPAVLPTLLTPSIVLRALDAADQGAGTATP